MNVKKFLEACEEGNFKAVKKYVEKGYDINALEDGYTGLYFACNSVELGSSDLSIVEYLLQNGADPSIPICNGFMGSVAQTQYANKDLQRLINKYSFWVKDQTQRDTVLEKLTKQHPDYNPNASIRELACGIAKTMSEKAIKILDMLQGSSQEDLLNETAAIYYEIMYYNSFFDEVIGELGNQFNVQSTFTVRQCHTYAKKVKALAKNLYDLNIKTSNDVVEFLPVLKFTAISAVLAKDHTALDKSITQNVNNDVITLMKNAQSGYRSHEVDNSLNELNFLK